jgi:hypothetical protein
MSEQHQTLRRVIVDAVAQAMGGRRHGIVDHRHLRRQKRPIEPIRYRKRRQRDED